MNPTVIISLGVVVFLVGSIGYSYHAGRVAQLNICQAEKLQSQLNSKTQELELQGMLSVIQQEEVEEFKRQSAIERNKSDRLEKDLAAIKHAPGEYCVPDSVLKELREFRYGIKDENS